MLAKRLDLQRSQVSQLEISPMKIQLYNSLSNQLEEFKSVEPGKVKMYSCGPTVYDFAHIGNFRSFLFGDLLRRFLELAGYEVEQVMNITDVGHMTDGEEDKMTTAANRVKENKKSGRVEEGEIEDPNDPYQIAEYYMNAFMEDAKKLNYKIAFEPDRVPRATDHVNNMIKMIEQLLDRGHAYVAPDGVVYYSVETFPQYGRLSNNSLHNLQEGAGDRISDDDQANKKHPSDFMLWKPDDHHIMKWDSPWGTGYPGWHIECSVMARELLKADVIDIHTGGEDLIFPHHECEIAQSCGATGEDSFANYWIHARFLFVEGEKMSKSKGNFHTARDVFEGRVIDGANVHPSVLRYELIKSHYRKNMNFTTQGLKDSDKIVRQMLKFQAELESATGGEADDVGLDHPILSEFVAALADDLNISGALSVVIPWYRSNPGEENPREALGVWRKINSVLGIAEDDEQSESEAVTMAWAEQKCEEMNRAREDKDWDKADAIRKEILDAGFKVNQTKDGATIEKQL